MNGIPALRRGQRGATMVEFAIIGVVFFLIVMGIFDLGRSILYYNMLSNGAREAARAGIVTLPTGRRTPDEICAVAGKATNFPDVTYPVTGCGTFGNLDVAVPDYGSWRPDFVDTDPLRVTLTYRFSPITPLIGAITGDPVVIGASATMYVEYAP